MKRFALKVLAAAALAACLATPVLFFLGRITSANFRTAFLLASLGYLLSAALLSRKPRP